MPRCFSLTKINDTTPTALQEVDREICAVLGQPVDDVHWCKLSPSLHSCFNWYDVLGLKFAMGCPLKGTDEHGRGLDALIDPTAIKTEEDKIIMADVAKVINYLRENYTVSAWWCSK